MNLSGYPRLSAQDLVRRLFQIGAVVYMQDEVLTWTSGLEVPFYCDNRLTNSYTELRMQITDRFVEHVVAQELQPEAIVGTATAGIAQAASLADRLRLPMAYARPEKKTHGRGRQLEGDIPPGTRVLVVEDLVSTGMSVLKVVDVLRETFDLKIIGIVAIFTYSFPNVAQRFEERGYSLFTIGDFPTLIDLGIKEEFLSTEAAKDLRNWYKDPFTWYMSRPEEAQK